MVDSMKQCSQLDEQYLPFFNGLLPLAPALNLSMYLKN